MKKLKKKSKTIDFHWLPPVEEWDFRPVTASECRVACHWEYERQYSRSVSKPGDAHKYFPQNYRQAARELFPQAWTTLTKEQRAKVMASFSATPVMQVRKLGEFLKRMPMNGGKPEIPKPYLESSYVIIPHFSLHGIESVLNEFEKWARNEANQYPRSRRAQAALPPFDALKWLAVARLDKARLKAGITIETARDTVKAYWQKNLRNVISNVFPVYSSDGAWVKARNNAQDCLTKSLGDPSYLLAELA